MVIVSFLVCLNEFINRGISKGMIVFKWFVMGLLLKFIFCVVCVLIILFVFFINVGIKWREMDIIKVNLCMGSLSFLNGFSKFFILFVILIGVVVKVSIVVIKIKNKKCKEIKIFWIRLFL